MQKLFNKILVPVDFSPPSKYAIAKAVEIALQYQCSIHLLHVETVSPFAVMAMAGGSMALPPNITDNSKELEYQLKKLAKHAQVLSAGCIQVEYNYQNGSWDEVITDMVNDNGFDLVLVGQQDRFFRNGKMPVNPDKIAARTTVPVITVPANRRLTRLYSLVIPITDFLPVRKLMYGVYIASGNGAVIKLIGVANELTKDKLAYFMNRSYQLIRDNCDVKVELDLIENNNVADAIRHFAVQKSADLVIVNPDTQTRMPGFFSSLMGNIIQKYAGPPVMTVTKL